MSYDFEKRALRCDNGNMKGHMEAEIPNGSILMSGAEMDFPTAPCIRKALAKFSQNGLYGYTLADSAYLESVRYWMKTIRDWEIAADWIVSTMGTIHGLNTALRAFTEPGDGVILQHPSYYRFDRAILQNGRKILSNPLIFREGRYHLDLEALEEKMQEQNCRMMVLCNPHNPTGTVFPENELAEAARLARCYRILVFSDEIFAETAQEGHLVLPFAELAPEVGITATSLGKAFNLTGVNQANLIVPDETLRERFQKQRGKDHFGSLDPFFYTALRTAYSEEGLDWIREMNRNTLRNYQRICQVLQDKLPELSLAPLEGTFVGWMDCRKLGLSDRELQRFMEQGAQLYGDPGDDYGPGGSGFYRWNLAVAESTVEKMLANLEYAITLLLSEKRGPH